MAGLKLRTCQSKRFQHGAASRGRYKSRSALIFAKALSYPARVLNSHSQKLSGPLRGTPVDSMQKSGSRLQRRTADDTLLALLEKLRQSRSVENPNTKAKQVEPTRPRPANPYGNKPCDLDRIAQAESGIEVLDILNQVLRVLQRSGRMAEVPEALRIDCLTTSIELRIALRKMQGEFPFSQCIDWNSDALFVLRTVLTAADKRLTELRRRE